jgi:AcrR family transcriptional regulator
MADVATEAGISRALVNHYFGSKRELYLETLHVVAAQGPSQVRTDLSLPVEEMVAANADSWLDFVEANPNTTMAISGGAFAGDRESLAALSELRDALVDRMLANHFGDDVDIPPSARLALRAYTGLWEVAVRDWLVEGLATREEVRVLLVESLLAIVREVIPRLDAVPQVTKRIVSG